MAEIDGPADHVRPGVVPARWREQRRLGTATASGNHANVGHSTWMALIRQNLAAEVLAAGFTEFDAHPLYMTNNRTLTQRISRLVFTHQFDGIRYLSKHGNEVECWAFFDQRVIFQDIDEQSICATDPELRQAMTVYDLKFSDD